MPQLKPRAAGRLLTAALLGLALALAGTAVTAPTHAAPEGVVVPTFQGGTVTTWGDTTFDQDQLPASLTGKTVTGIAAGAGHNLAITSDGRLTGWGCNNDDQATVPVTLTGKTVTAAAAGAFHSLALTSDGTLTGWGRNNDFQATVPDTLTGKTVTAIEAGTSHSLALTSDGRVTAWGSNVFDQTKVPTSLNGKTVTAIAAGGMQSLALTSDGKVTAWGSNGSGPPTVPASLDGKTVTAIAAGWDHALALTSDGKVTAWGTATSASTTVPASLDDKTVTAIATGGEHALALTSDGIVVAWGRTEADQTKVPTGLTGKVVTAIAANGNQSLAIATAFAAEGAPTVTGNPTPGATLTAVPSRYTVDPGSLGYQWYADGVAIPGATTPTLTLTSGHSGKRITVWVTATKTGHPTVVTSSAPLGPVAGKSPTLQLEAAETSLRRGQATTLTWTSTDATTLTASGGWTGTRGATGTIEVKPTAIGIATYVLTATNAQGTTTAQVRVQVTRPAKRLKVTGPKGIHRPGTKVKVTVRGLEAGEKYTIRIGKKKVATGTAENSRPLVKKVKLPQARGKVAIRATGDQPDRTGTAKLRVRR